MSLHHRRLSSEKVNRRSKSVSPTRSKRSKSPQRRKPGRPRVKPIDLNPEIKEKRNRGRPKGSLNDYYIDFGEEETFEKDLRPMKRVRYGSDDDDEPMETERIRKKEPMEKETIFEQGRISLLSPDKRFEGNFTVKPFFNVEISEEKSARLRRLSSVIIPGKQLLYRHVSKYGKDAGGTVRVEEDFISVAKILEEQRNLDLRKFIYDRMKRNPVHFLAKYILKL